MGYVSEGMTDSGAGMMALVAVFTKASDVAYAAEGSYNRLGDIKIPVLAAQGHRDVMIPTVNSYQQSQTSERLVVDLPWFSRWFLVPVCRTLCSASERLLGWMVKIYLNAERPSRHGYRHDVSTYSFMILLIYIILLVSMVYIKI